MHMVHSSNLTRRSVIQKTLVAGLSAPVLASLVGAQPARAARLQANETPQRGGIVRLGAAGSPENLNPQMTIIMESNRVNYHLYSGLTRLDINLTPQPDLALSWTPNETADVWTFKLRTGVKFHDGADCTSDDVVSSFEHIMDPNSGSVAASLLTMVDKVKATAADEVQFVLNAPYADMPRLLSNLQMMVIPVKFVDTLSTQPVGTGPYMLVENVPGQRTVLKRFDDYFDLENEAFIDEIHIIPIPEEASKVAALVGGQIDVVNELLPISLPLVQNAPGIVLDEVPSGSYQPIVMMCDRPPFDDERVRLALKKTLDREEFVAAVLQGHGVTAADQPIPPFDPMYGDLPIPTQDIEGAKALLAEAGYPDGIDIEIHTSTGRVGMQESALTLQQQAAPAGFRFSVQSHPIDNYWAEIWKQVPIFTSNWGGESPDYIFSLNYISTTDQSESKWSNPEFDRLVDEARGELDEPTRRELYTEAQKIMAESGPIIVPYFRAYISAWNEKLQGYPLHPDRMTDFRQAWIKQG
jgi:peptide/nickel transport system substrate-binding protein